MFKRFSSLIYRVAYRVNENELPPVQTVKGAIDGFLWAWDADIEVASAFFQAVADPVSAAKLTAKAFNELFELAIHPQVTFQVIAQAMPELDPLGLYLKSPYYAGWILGFLLEMTIVKTAFLAAGVFTAGAVAAAAASAAAIRLGTWLAGMTEKMVAVIRVMRQAAESLQLAKASRVTAKAVQQAIMKSGVALEYFAKYGKQAGPVYDELVKVANTAGSAATTILSRTINWLSFFDRMTDAGAVRLVGYYSRVASAESRFAAWAALPRGRQAVGRAFDVLSEARHSDDIVDRVISALGIEGQILSREAIDGLAYAARHVDDETLAVFVRGNTRISTSRFNQFMVRVKTFSEANTGGALESDLRSLLIKAKGEVANGDIGKMFELEVAERGSTLGVFGALERTNVDDRLAPDFVFGDKNPVDSLFTNAVVTVKSKLNSPRLTLDEVEELTLVALAQVKGSRTAWLVTNATELDDALLAACQRLGINVMRGDQMPF